MGYYESRFVGKGRKTKWCSVCEKEIPIGESAYSYKEMDSGDYYTRDVHPECVELLESHGYSMESYLDADEEEQEKMYDDAAGTKLLIKKLEIITGGSDGLDTDN